MAQARDKMNYPLCTEQIGCDGDLIKTGRDMCCKCERVIEKRNRIVKALRGEYLIQTEEAKKVKHGRD